MHKADLAARPCSLARTLGIVGEWWTLLVLRDICFGLHRFEEIHDHLGIARNILKARLDTLLDHGMVERHRYQQRPQRFEYLPTDKAIDFVPALLALVAWGDRWTAPSGPPLLFTHRTCGHDTAATVVCSACLTPLTRADIDFRPGPGSPQALPGMAGGMPDVATAGEVAAMTPAINDAVPVSATRSRDRMIPPVRLDQLRVP